MRHLPRYASRRVNAPQIEDRRVAAQTEGRAHERSEVAARSRAARVLGGVVDGCFLSFAAVEGSKERDEGSPTSGAWGVSAERCLSGGGEMKAKGKRLLGT